MPLFSDHITNMYYSGTPSYSSPYSYSGSPYGTSYSASYLNPGGNYTNHSSLTPYTRTLSSRYLLGSGRTYSPILSTISEKGTTSPVRINSPRRTPITRSYIPSYTSRPININTADIDVSREKYRNRTPTSSSLSTELRRPSPTSNNKQSSSDVAEKPSTGVDSSRGSPPQRSTIKRDRPVVRLHTVKRKDRDSPKKPIENTSVENSTNVAKDKEKLEPLKWRERLAEDLAFKNKKEKKTIGEKLVEKFTLKDKDNNDVESNTLEMTQCSTTDEQSPQPIAAQDTSIESNQSLGRRCSMELLAEQASLLDSLIRRENLSTATLDLSKIGTEPVVVNKTNDAKESKKRKFTQQINPLTTTKSDHSLLSKRCSKRKSVRKSTSGENICKLDCISETSQLLNLDNTPVIEEDKLLNKNDNEILEKKPKLKQRITSTVEISPPSSPLKFVVENVTVEEKPLPKKKDIVFSAVIEDVHENVTPKKLSSNAVDTDHRKSVKIKLKSDQKNLNAKNVVSPEPDDGNFWGKIGKRETVYLINRKKDLEKAKEDQTRSFCWFPENDEIDLKKEKCKNDSVISSKINDIHHSKDKNTKIEENNDSEQLIKNKKIEETCKEQQGELLKSAHTETKSVINVSENKHVANSNVQELNKEYSNSKEILKEGDGSNLSAGAVDKKENIKTTKIQTHEKEDERSIEDSKTKSNNDNVPIVSSDSLKKEVIPESSNKNIKIAKKYQDSKDNDIKASPIKSKADEPKEVEIESNERDKNVEQNDMKKDPEIDLNLPTAKSDLNLPNTCKNEKANEKDEERNLIKQTETKSITGDVKAVQKSPKSIPNAKDLNKNDEKTHPKIQHDEEPKPDIDKLKNSSPKPTLETNMSSAILKDDLIEENNTEPKLQTKPTLSLNQSSAVPVKDMNKYDSDKDSHSENKTKPKEIFPSTSDNKITTIPIKKDINENELLEEKKKSESDSLRSKENLEGVIKQEVEHRNLDAENNHKESELNKETSKDENIPRRNNTDIRLSQKQKFDCNKTDNVENEIEKDNKRESVKKPIRNEGINMLFANRKPVKDVPAPKPLIATPRPLQKKAPQVIRSSSSSETSSSEESSDEDDDESSESSTDVYECENNADGRTSTGSNDSGFDSSAPTSPSGFSYARKDCDVNCHRKCEKLTANLCGVNQRLLVEALASRTTSKRGADHPSTSTSAVQNNNHDIVQQELEQSTAYGIFRKTGRFTPPARSIPRFRKYTIDDFQFIKVLGKGSFGKVMLAELRETEYYYAVKCLKKDVVLEDDDVECTLIERKVLALGTNHPYLCHLFATFQTDSHLFFVMEYLNGGDLMFHIQQSGRFPEPRARFYAAEIVSGLKFLHKRGIVYRDLKLDNILLDFDGHVRIADFGMCKLQIYLDKTADTFCGTPDYMAPEIIKGLKYNQTVDWWSFGVLLYEMLIGQSPFSGCDEDELFWSICNEMPSYPRFLSSESLSILTRLLDKDARTRLGGVECMHGDIRDQDFFKTIQWDKLERRELEAPFKPRVRHPLDTQYFDRAFTGERPRLTAVEPQVLRSMDQEPFRGFSYTNPNATDR